MVIEMLFYNKIQIVLFWTEFIFSKKIYIGVHYWKKFTNKFSIFSFGQIIIRYDLLYLKFCVMFKWSMV